MRPLAAVTPSAVLIVVTAALLGACSSTRHDPTPVEVAPSVLDAVMASPAQRAGAPLTELLGVVPADADALGAIDFASFGPELEQLMGGSPAVDALKRDLDAIFGRLLGPDLAATRHAVAWMNLEQKAFGVALHGEFGKARMKGAKLETIAGLKALPLDGAWLAPLGGHMVAGNEAGLAAMVAVHKKRRAGLAGSPAWTEMEAGLKLVRGTDPLILVSAGRQLLAAAVEKTPMRGSDFSQMSFAIGRDLSVAAAVQGSSAARGQLEAMIELARRGARGNAESQRQEALASDDVVVAVTGVVTAHALFAGLEMLKLSTEGDSLVARVQPPTDVTTYMTVTSVLAAVAVPAYLKYMRRAKTAEAIDELDRIYRGAALYYSTPRVDQLGNRLPCQFPRSQPATPKAGTCCHALGGPDRDKDDRCDSNPEAWTTPTWSALGFDLSEPHYFVYSFESSGTGSAATMTITAHGDLDCDGIQSTFRRTGRADPESGDGECFMGGNSVFFKDKETE